MTSVLIAGDLCPIGKNLPLFQAGDAKGLFHDLLPEFERADFSIVNLECPLIGEPAAIRKIGPVLGAPRDCVSGLAAARIDAVNLGNNHILDHGPRGLISTRDACREKGIETVGGGRDLREAGAILIRESGGCRIGVLAAADHEFSSAGPNRPGANPLDLITLIREIENRRGDFDYLVVLLHSGSEHYPYPSPRLMETCRFLVERGAGAVICQQSHIAGCAETYRGGQIVYGQGNFIFDFPSPQPEWNRGLLISLEIEPGGASRIRLIPCRQSAGETGVRRLEPEAEKRFLEGFSARSEEIRDPAAVETRWREYCRRQERHLLHLLSGRDSLLRRVAVRTGLASLLDSPKRCRTRLHPIRCESLREALISVLEKRALNNRRG